jgi:anti-sigma regulatory factor (Ser/Thr protein kinase)
MKSALLEQELPRSHDAPWLARRALGDWFGSTLASDELHGAKLLTSELVTNAIMHGRGRIVMSAHLDGDTLRVEVADEGPGFDYAADRRSLDHLRGRGLTIVQAESSRWGVNDDSARVWFELQVRSGAGRAAG